MNSHAFIFHPGSWLGEGKISLNVTEEELPFFTKWRIKPIDDEGKIACAQEIQISGMSEVMNNEFVFSVIHNNQFQIELENQNLGTVVGTGIIRENLIGWEFRLGQLGFEGFEFYTRDENGDYLVHAEYATNDEFRTVIHGKVWKQLQEKKSRQPYA